MIKYALIFLIFHNVINGSPFQNGVKKATLPSWISQLNGRSSDREQNDSISFRISLSGKLANPINVAGGIGNHMPFVEMGGSHYYFQTYFKANYFKAFQYCREHGMDLFSIESKEEHDLIINYMKKNMTTVENLWTSGTDMAEEGTFVWLSTGQTFTFNNWRPPFVIDTYKEVKHCLHIYKRGPQDYIWDDTPCTKEFYFACELKSTLSPLSIFAMNTSKN